MTNGIAERGKASAAVSTDVQLQPCQSSRRLPVIEDLPVQSLHKLVALGNIPSGNSRDPVPSHDVLPVRQAFASVFKVLLIHTRAESVCVGRKRYSRDAGYFQRMLFLSAQLLDLEFDRLPQALRRFRMDVLGGHLDLPDPISTAIIPRSYRWPIWIP